MKLRELFSLLGFRSLPKRYSYAISTFELPTYGQIQYAQWHHPAETEKIISQEIVEEIRKFISEGDVAIDIGAHTGDTTIPMAIAAGSKGCVFAIEPNSYVFPVLQKNSALNAGKTNIIPLMFAATSQAGDFEFEYSDEGFCNGGFHEGISKWRHGHAFKLKVRGENLQIYLEENYPELLPRISYLKVDAEGYDFAVLLSLEKLILSNRPFIKCEVYKHLNSAQRQRLFDFLAQKGYSIYKVEADDNYLGTSLTDKDMMNWRHFDIFCVPE